MRPRRGRRALRRAQPRVAQALRRNCFWPKDGLSRLRSLHAKAESASGPSRGCRRMRVRARLPRGRAMPSVPRRFSARSPRPMGLWVQTAQSPRPEDRRRARATARKARGRGPRAPSRPAPIRRPSRRLLRGVRPPARRAAEEGVQRANTRPREARLRGSIDPYCIVVTGFRNRTFGD